MDGEKYSSILEKYYQHYQQRNSADNETAKYFLCCLIPLECKWDLPSP